MKKENLLEEELLVLNYIWLGSILPRFWYGIWL